MQLGLILLVFGVVFIAELPDKSLFAALILGTKFPARLVWIGAALAFLTHVIIAVTAGNLLTLLPHRAVEGIVACLFLLGSGLLFFGKHGLEDEDIEADEAKKLSKKAGHNPWKVILTAYTIVFIGEWGDITQIAIINYTAKYQDTFNVAIGATLALWCVAGLAVTVGNKALDVVPPRILQRVTATILLIFGLISSIAAIHG